MALGNINSISNNKIQSLNNSHKPNNEDGQKKINILDLAENDAAKSKKSDDNDKKKTLQEILAQAAAKNQPYNIEISDAAKKMFEASPQSVGDANIVNADNVNLDKQDEFESLVADFRSVKFGLGNKASIENKDDMLDFLKEKLKINTGFEFSDEQITKFANNNLQTQNERLGAIVQNTESRNPTGAEILRLADINKKVNRLNGYGGDTNLSDAQRVDVEKLNKDFNSIAISSLNKPLTDRELNYSKELDNKLNDANRFKIDVKDALGLKNITA